jgi:hypothetical protein
MDVSVKSARRASNSKVMEGLARWGLGARAFLYVVLGVLTGAIAIGRSTKEDDQQGALTLLSQQTGGKVLLVLVAIGLFGYALWRLSEAAFGVAGDHGKGPRVQSLVRGIVYTGLGVTTITVLHSSGTSKSQSFKQQSASAQLLQHTGGRLLLGIIGAVVIVVGLVMISDGVRKKFLTFLRTSDLNPQQRRLVEWTGTIGTCARGVIFALAGGLVVAAAARKQAQKASGLDGALRTLSSQPYGEVLLLAAAAGLLVFGLYGFAEARWHKT